MLNRKRGSVLTLVQAFPRGPDRATVPEPVTDGAVWGHVQ